MTFDQNFYLKVDIFLVRLVHRVLLLYRLFASGQNSDSYQSENQGQLIWLKIIWGAYLKVLSLTAYLEAFQNSTFLASLSCTSKKQIAIVVSGFAKILYSIDDCSTKETFASFTTFYAL